MHDGVYFLFFAKPINNNITGWTGTVSTTQNDSDGERERLFTQRVLTSAVLTTLPQLFQFQSIQKAVLV